ncbi:arabinose isomerase [Treponema sp. OMZ 840]|uniref:arabinose isomerase n=1 Tax=Treponema sp. OMZ 840 TaxID=244313 RepID=UPI003D94F7FC
MTKIGLFGIGLDTYWNQFNGLKERLTEYQNKIFTQMQTDEVEIINGGLVDNPASAQKIGSFFQQEGIDLIFIYISTYALSHTVLPVLQTVKVPAIILNIQPTAAIDYTAFNNLNDRGLMTGEWLAHCSACSVPEIAHICNKANLPYDIITGYLNEEYVWTQIKEWIHASRTVKELQQSRIGILGHYYCGMLDVYTDITELASVFGCHFELLEIDELAQYHKAVSKRDIMIKRQQFETEFKIDSECEAFELDRAAQTSCALDTLVEKRNLHAMAYYYEGTPGSTHENIVTSVIAGNTLLTAHHIPVAGECEVKNVLAMKIMDILKVGGSFAELYAMDFNDDIILWGHDGPAHPTIADGQVALVPLPVYHGKPGKGLSIQMTVKQGPVTFLAVVQGRSGKTLLLIAEGESVVGPVLQIGNTNSRYKFPISARAFVDKWSKQGPSHHCAIGIGHIHTIIEKIAFLLGIECIKIC